MCNDEEKMLEAILKDGMLDRQKPKHLSLTLCKILVECGDHMKTTLKRC
jgi:hypothetical protein